MNNKPFDLEKALAGEPVKLRNGNKAFVLARISDTEVKSNGRKVNYPLLGYVCNKDGRYDSTEQWTDNGKFTIYDEEHLFDIVEMWQEPRPRVQLDLPCPLKELSLGEHYYYIDFWIDTISKKVESIVVCGIFNNSILDEYRLNQGRCFATEEDAQEWLDAMRNARR